TFAGTKAYRTEMNHPASIEITNIMERTWGEPPVRIRTMGGTVPMAPFAETFGFPIISIPVVNFDNNQHSENENLRLENLWKAIVTFAAVLTSDTRPSIGVSPARVQSGDPVYLAGTGFTPDRTVMSHLVTPDKSEYNPLRFRTNERGEFF